MRYLLVIVPMLAIDYAAFPIPSFADFVLIQVGAVALAAGAMLAVKPKRS